MNWNDGYEAQYYVTIVDADSWRDLQRFETEGGSVNKEPTNLMQSASLNLTDIPGEGELWIRVWLDARQEGDGAHEALFTGLMFTPEAKWNGIMKSYKADCYSVLKPAADILLDKGWYAPAGSGASLVADLLSVGPAPVEYAENSPTLTNSIVAEHGETNLSMARKIAEALGWRFRIKGDGRISVEPQGTEPEVTVDSLENDVVELEITDRRDWFSCPNVFRATARDMTAVARDDSEDSPLSTVNRGREIWKEDANAKLNDGESIAEYAQRRLKEEQSPSRRITYNRRFIPGVLPGDAIQIHYPAQNIDGVFRISSQQIELGYAARTSEEVIEL